MFAVKYKGINDVIWYAYVNTMYMILLAHIYSFFSPGILLFFVNAPFKTTFM